MYEDIEPRVIYHVSKRCNKQWSLKNEKINFNDLTFITDGQATYYSNGVKYDLTKGDVIFIPKGNTRMAMTTGMECYAFNFDYNGTPGPTLESFIHWEDIGILTWFLKEFNKQWISQSPYYQVKCKGVFLCILYELLTSTSQERQSAHIVKIKKYIIDHILDKLSIKVISEYIGLNKVYCGALFKENEGRSIAEYINNIRINKAVALLELDDLNISQIAVQTGFDDIYYFSRVFKQIKGVSPSAYREFNMNNNIDTNHRNS